MYYSNQITLSGADAKFRTEAGVAVTDIHAPYRGGAFGGTESLVVSNN